MGVKNEGEWVGDGLTEDAIDYYDIYYYNLIWDLFLFDNKEESVINSEFVGELIDLYGISVVNTSGGISLSLIIPCYLLYYYNLLLIFY